MSLGQNPLGKIMNITSALSLDVTYAYEDLVFIENNAFLFRFDDNAISKAYLHFNHECNPKSKSDLEYKLKLAAKTEKLELLTTEDYKLVEGKNEGEFQIEFLTD